MLLAQVLGQGAGSALGVWVAMKISPRHPILAAGIIGAVTALGVGLLVRALDKPAP